MVIDMEALRAKAKQRNVEKKPEFIPIELNEGDVHAIFNRCLATETTAKEDILTSILFSRVLGYRPEDEIAFHFDKQEILKNKKNIEYLYGQLRSCHKKSKEMTFDEAFYLYSDKMWTSERAHVLELLYLGNTFINIISPFFAEKNATILKSVVPTLSPKDPAFPAWWKQHRAEWED